MGEAARTRHGYDQVATRYAAELRDELAAKPLDRGLLDAFAELTRDGTVLDVGCGPGQIGAYVGGRVVGFDLSPAMCATSAIPASAADMTALPVRSGSVSGIVSYYAVIHLAAERRAAAYAEFARVLRPGGHALIAFHTSDADIPTGGTKRLTQWWGHDVDLAFHYLDPDQEIAALAVAGLPLVARLDREPHPGVEHPSRRTALLVRVPGVPNT
ncbi:class I SAM-dependent methyltransferase [Actinokineospora sp. HUAS TT18]|uniref:class I SAM-dependent methyltransferase n=1 Tax=Actinokineospora sp. HUAS TT18 TaxID=3447451 RepID=UPI003F51D1EA